MKKALLVCLVLLFGLSACNPTPQEGVYKRKNQLLEIAQISSEKFAFQCISYTNDKIQYISGKAHRSGKNIYTYTEKGKVICFDFAGNMVKVRQLENKNAVFFEGVYRYAKPSEYEKVHYVQAKN